MNLDRLDAENQRELVHPGLLIGEGKSDASFLMRLMERRDVRNIHFGFPTEATGGYGLPALGKYLSSLLPRTGFSRLRAALVFYDNDSDPVAAFNSVRDAVDVSKPYIIPATGMVLAPPDRDKVRLMFIPMPGPGLDGAIETLMLRSVPADAASVCVDAFATCVAIHPWSASHQSKMRLRSLIAAKCRGNSDMTLTNIWNVAGNPIDLTHSCFDDVERAVRDVVAAV